MSEVPQSTRPKAPWQLWVVGILSLLWNCMGALDYLMTETRNQAYMSKFTPEELQYFYGLPAWVISTWAIAVWGGVLGSVLLLMRKRLAYPVFIVSFISLLITMFHNLVLSPGPAGLRAPGPMAFTAAIVIVAFLLIVFAGAQSKRGVLG